MPAALAEPAVLAAAKDTLYPDIEQERERYAVTETQFTRREWGSWEIPSAIRDRLAPYNVIRLASGEPDLLGVGMPANRVLNGEVATRPVVAVEAKGTTGDGTVDVARGIDQAHAHLPEVNLSYVAAPIGTVTETDRALARELSVGIVGVRDAGTAEVVEPPRIAGAGELSTDIEAIRFQARANRLTAGSFPVNHPKNYLGYALALAAEGDTDELYEDRIIAAAAAGRRGAILLGLVSSHPRGDALTQTGAEVVRFARRNHGTIEAALAVFDDWTRKRKRFTAYAPRWAQLARGISVAYEPTALVIDALEQLHASGVASPTLPAVARSAVELKPALAIEVFFSRNSRDRVLTRDGDLVEPALEDPGIYKSGLHFQFKAQLFHVGLLTSRGTDDAESALDDEWVLEEPVGLEWRER